MGVYCRDVRQAHQKHLGQGLSAFAGAWGEAKKKQPKISQAFVRRFKTCHAGVKLPLQNQSAHKKSLKTVHL